MNDKELLANFYSFIFENQVKEEVLIDDYYQKNRTKENEKELKKACLYGKALINRDAGSFERSNTFYKQLLEQDLFTFDDLEKSMVGLFICQNYIKLNKKKEALHLINTYFNQNKRGYDLDYLVCYANVTEDTVIREPYTSILNNVLKKLGYKKELPKNFDEFLELHNLYKKENTQVGQILMLSDRLKQEKSIANFINQTSFSLLAEQFKK